MGDKTETVTDFIFLASKITADGDCSHDIKRHLVHRRKPMTNLDNWCFWTVALENTLESPLDCKEIKPVHSEGDQLWIFIGRTEAEDEAPVLWPPDVKSQLIVKDPDGGKDWGWEEKGVTEDEMVGWQYWLNRHEFEQILGGSVGHGSMACCSPWCPKVSDTTEWLNNNNQNHKCLETEACPTFYCVFLRPAHCVFLEIMWGGWQIAPYLGLLAQLTPSWSPLFGNVTRLLKCDITIVILYLCVFCENLTYFTSVQLLSRVRLFATTWITALQASLSITNSRSLPKLMSIESVSFILSGVFLHWSLVAYWASTDLGVHLSVSYLFAFSYC